jgi:hypothetical protein
MGPAMAMAQAVKSVAAKSTPIRTRVGRMPRALDW